MPEPEQPPALRSLGLVTLVTGLLEAMAGAVMLVVAGTTYATAWAFLGFGCLCTFVGGALVLARRKATAA